MFSDIGHAVSCEYLGRYDERTGTILSGLARSVPKRAGVVFLYKVENESVARSVVLAKCKNVLERARVPLPSALGSSIGGNGNSTEGRCGRSTPLRLAERRPLRSFGHAEARPSAAFICEPSARDARGC